jgi:hypothetical protein
MQELACVEPSSTASAMMPQRPHSSNSTGGMACYKNPYFESTATSAPGIGSSSLGLRPASSGGSPLIAQHNNLVSPRVAGSLRPGSSGSHRSSREEYLQVQLGLAKVKTKL